MPGYRVSFYKDVLSSDGHCFKCLQHEIHVPESDSTTHAAEFASRAFASLHGLRDWTLYADSLEVVPVETAVEITPLVSTIQRQAA